MLETAGGTLTSEQVSDVLGITRQAVDKRRASHQLLALTQGKRGYSYPSFQFKDGKTLPGLEDVLAELKALDPWMQMVFFTNPHERLGGDTPLERLRQGGVEEAKIVAVDYGDLRERDLEVLQAIFGRYGTRLYGLARGVDENPVRPNRPTQSVSAEDTFERDVLLAETEPMIRQLAEKA
jgi:hypothetical protein